MKNAIVLSKRVKLIRKLFYSLFKNNKEVFTYSFVKKGKLIYPEMQQHVIMRTDSEGVYVLGFDHTTEEFVAWEKTIPAPLVFFGVITIFYVFVMMVRA